MDIVAAKMVGGWPYVTTLGHHYNERIWITWRPDFYHLVSINMNAQAVTCSVKYSPFQASFTITYVYAFNTK